MNAAYTGATVNVKCALKLMFMFAVVSVSLRRSRNAEIFTMSD